MNKKSQASQQQNQNIIGDVIENESERIAQTFEDIFGQLDVQPNKLEEAQLEKDLEQLTRNDPT